MPVMTSVLERKKVNKKQRLMRKMKKGTDITDFAS